MTETVQRCFWGREDLAGYDIPVEASGYLQTFGLPSRVGDSTIEFGIYDSPDRCVIGQDFDYPIYIERDGSVWSESGDGEPEPQFMNSSLGQLDQFVSCYHTWWIGVEDNDSSAMREAMADAIRSLQDIDPAAFSNDRWIWPQIWKDISSLC